MSINPSLLLKEKKQRQEFAYDKRMQKIAHGDAPKKYRLKCRWDNSYLDGMFTMDECLRKMSAMSLSLYIMEKV